MKTIAVILGTLAVIILPFWIVELLTPIALLLAPIIFIGLCAVAVAAFLAVLNG